MAVMSPPTAASSCCGSSIVNREMGLTRSVARRLSDARDPQRCYLLGVEFSKEQRQVVAFEVKEAQQR